MSEKEVIWVVDSGEYSDYGVGAIFTEEKLAKDWVEVRGLKGRDYRVGEWELNPTVYKIPVGFIPYQASIRIDGKISILEAREDYQDNPLIMGTHKAMNRRFAKSDYGVSCYFMARDKAHATKIASELHTKHRLNGEFD